jgi:hypothetical protein
MKFGRQATAQAQGTVGPALPDDRCRPLGVTPKVLNYTRTRSMPPEFALAT